MVSFKEGLNVGEVEVIKRSSEGACIKNRMMFFSVVLEWCTCECEDKGREL